MVDGSSTGGRAANCAVAVCAAVCLTAICVLRFCAAASAAACFAASRLLRLLLGLACPGAGLQLHHSRALIIAYRAGLYSLDRQSVAIRCSTYAGVDVTTSALHLLLLGEAQPHGGAAGVTTCRCDDTHRFAG